MRIPFSERRAERRRHAWARPLALAFSIVPSSLAAGCLSYPNSDERLDDEIVYTHYKKEADFKEFKTFAISSEIVEFSEDDGEIEREVLDAELAEPVIEAVIRNMTGHGYTQVTREEDPDLGLTVSVLSGTVTTFYTDYWGYYWGYPYYPYYPYYYTYSYDTGTVVVDAVDLKNAPPPDPDAAPPVPGGDADPALEKLDVVWTGLVYGVKESTSENVQDAVKGIDQAFRQSQNFRTSDGD
jgi:hypothetical protein